MSKILRKIYFLNPNNPQHTIHISLREQKDTLLEKYCMEITFADIKILNEKIYFNKLLRAITNSFIDYTKRKKAESIYVPSNCEIISFDEGFIDVYYDSIFAIDKDEALHLTTGLDINKSIIVYDIDLPNAIELKFNSLFAIDENNKIKSIWEISNKEVLELFKESIENKIN